MVLYFFKSEKKFSSSPFFNCIVIHSSMTSLFIDFIAHFMFYTYSFPSSQSLFIFIHLQISTDEKINKRPSNDKLEKQAPSRKRSIKIRTNSRASKQPRKMTKTTINTLTSLSSLSLHSSSYNIISIFKNIKCR